MLTAPCLPRRRFATFYSLLPLVVTCCIQFALSQLQFMNMVVRRRCHIGQGCAYDMHPVPNMTAEMMLDLTCPCFDKTVEIQKEVALPRVLGVVVFRCFGHATETDVAVSAQVQVEEDQNKPVPTRHTTHTPTAGHSNLTIKRRLGPHLVGSSASAAAQIPQTTVGSCGMGSASCGMIRSSGNQREPVVRAVLRLLTPA